MIIRTHKSALQSRYRPRLEILEDRTLLSVCTVDRLSDTGDGSGLMGDLRYCITTATDGDTITFADGLAGTINLTRALPDLTHTISIEGPGPDMLAVRRDTGGNYRIFTVVSGPTVVLTGLTITNGLAVNGAGILNNGMLTLTNATVSGNSTPYVYGASGGGIANSGTLTLENTTVRDNSVAGSRETDAGGGIYNGQGGMVTLDNSTVSGNTARNEGGGIFNGGMLTLTNSAISSNRASFGGGINNVGTLTLDNTTVSGNSERGIVNYDYGTATLTNTTVSGNSDGVGGAGIYNGALATLMLSNSTVSDNYDRNSAGGIYNEGTLILTNCTISGNSSTDYWAGGIFNYGTLTLINCTISGNSTAGMRGGGGIVNASGPSVRLRARNTILAGNMASTAPDLAGSLTSSGYNLIGNTDGGSGFDDTDLLNVDPLLGSLQDNGGPTQTMALQCRSPAIDAGDNTDAPDWDQRGPGFPRIVNGIIDIGAYELQKGECDGSAPHGSRDKLIRFVGTALFHHEMPQSGFPNIPLSVDLKMNTLPDYVPPTSTEPDTFSISRPGEKPPVHNSVFLDLNWDLPVKWPRKSIDEPSP
jgi:hypothetical protein